MDNSGGMTFTELLAQPDVVERVELRSRFGFFAYHGGPVERVTTLVASRAAEAAGATYYGIDQPPDRPLHLPSTRYTPDESPALAEVLDHIDVVATIHGYGRDREKQHVLLGGQNRSLAEHVGSHLRAHLDPKFPVITDLDAIPKELRGVHPRNPVNLPRGGGVQIELPPAVRWNWKAMQWADGPGLEPTRHVQALVAGLSEAAQTWELSGDSPN